MPPQSAANDGNRSSAPRNDQADAVGKRDRFASMDATAITVADRKAHIAERRAAGIKDGTIYTELGRLRIVARLVRQAGPHPQGGLHRTPIRSRSRPKASTSRALIRRALDGSRFPHMRQAMTLHDCGPQRCAMRGLTWVAATSNASASTSATRPSRARARTAPSCPCCAPPRRRCRKRSGAHRQSTSSSGVANA